MRDSSTPLGIKKKTAAREDTRLSADGESAATIQAHLASNKARAVYRRSTRLRATRREQKFLGCWRDASTPLAHPARQRRPCARPPHHPHESIASGFRCRSFALSSKFPPAFSPSR